MEKNSATAPSSLTGGASAMPASAGSSAGAAASAKANSRTTAIARTGMIAAVYAAATLVALLALQGLAWGPVQFRISEAVCVLALLTPNAIPGLTIGCALANLIERWARGSVTDYVYLPRAVIPFFRRIIWNTADLSVLTGCITAVIALLHEKL